MKARHLSMATRPVSVDSLSLPNPVTVDLWPPWSLTHPFVPSFTDVPWIFSNLLPTQIRTVPVLFIAADVNHKLVMAFKPLYFSPTRF